MIFYFSATGNSRFVAESIGREIGEQIVEIKRRGYEGGEAENEIKKQEADLFSNIDANEDIGFVFPIYGWRLPEIVDEFIQHLAAQINPPMVNERYIWVAVTCGDDIGMADRCINRSLRAAGLHMDAIFSVTMPNTYVCLPGFDVDRPEIRRQKLSSCTERVASVTESVKNKTKITDIHRGLFPFFKTYVLGAFFRRFLITDKPFHATDACTHCGLCAHLCPLSNISVSLTALPHWHGYCTGCLKCYHNCPVHAIRFGKQTEKKGQYTFRRFSAEIRL